MNHYLKLVHMEIHRFRYILAGMMGFTAIVQLAVLAMSVAGEVSRREQAALRGETVTNGSAFFPGDKMSFAKAIFDTPVWFTVPIALCMAVLGLYALLIWYRDWLGRDTFIYRLLMLPSARRNLYLSKLTALLVFIFAMLAFQLVLLLVEKAMFNLMVPEDMRTRSSFAAAVEANVLLNYLVLPGEVTDFATTYGLGIVAVLALFTAVLLERSYRLPGIVYGLLYLAACVVAVVLTPFLLGIEDAGGYFYPEEIYAAVLAVIGLVGVVSVWLGFRLLARKVTV